jgi:hypothetical protein
LRSESAFGVDVNHFSVAAAAVVGKLRRHAQSVRQSEHAGRISGRQAN